MDKPINFNLLNKAELEYEIKIRLEEPAETVIQQKQQIQRLLQTSEPIILNSTLPITDDLEECHATASYIQNKINNLSSSTSKFLPKIESYLNHLYHRLDRIDIDLQPDLKENYDSLQALLTNLYRKLDNFTFQTANDNPEPISLPTNINPTTNPDLSSSSFPTSSDTNKTFIRDIKRYSFDGTTCPRAFLQKIEEFRIARHIPKNYLLDHIYEIFNNNALHWLRFQRSISPNLTWDELCEKLTRDFDTPDYDDKLLTAIKNRTQGQNEPIVIFLSIIHGMFSRLTTMPTEEERLKIIKKNIRPCYSILLAHQNYKTVEALLTGCQNYELLLDKERNFKEPTHDPSPIANDFNYKTTSPSTSNPSQPKQKTPFTPYTQPTKTTPYQQHNFIQYNKPFRQPIPSQHVNTTYTQQNTFCVRCRVHGHTLNTCTQPRFPICFKCGQKGIKTPDCPKCNVNQKN